MAQSLLFSKNHNIKKENPCTYWVLFFFSHDCDFQLEQYAKISPRLIYGEYFSQWESL